MRLCVIAWLIITEVVAQAGMFVPMTGVEINAALTEETLDYPGGWQTFHASGRTLFNSGQDSWGYWEVKDDQYCSQWPPSREWTCYDMERAGDTLRFIGPANDQIEGTLRK